MKPTSLLFIRLGLAASMLGHGIVRLPKLTKFAAGVVEGFSETLLPEVMVWPFAYAIPVVELVTGLLLLVGFKLKETAIVVSGLMIFLILGTCLQENWGALTSQLVHLAFAVLLIEFGKGKVE